MIATKPKALPIGNLNDFQRERHIFDLSFKNAIGRFSIITPNIFRIQYSTRKDWEYKPLLAIEDKEWKSVPLQIKRHGEKIDITTPRLIVSLVFRPFNIRIYNHEGRLLTQDNPRISVTLKGNQIAVHKKSPLGAPFFGLGDLPGPMDRSGKLHKLEMLESTDESLKEHLNPQLVFPMFCHPGKDVAIGYFVDNPTNLAVDLRNTAKGDFTMAVDNSELDYYCIVGKDIDEVVRSYSILVGNSAFPPRWSIEIMKGLDSKLELDSFLKIYDPLRNDFLLTSSVTALQPKNDQTGLWDPRIQEMLRSFRRTHHIPHFLVEMNQEIIKKKISSKELASLKESQAIIKHDSIEKGLSRNGAYFLDHFYESGRDYVTEKLVPLFKSGLRGIEIRNGHPPWCKKSIKKTMVHCVQEVIAEDGETVEKLVHEVEARNLLGYLPNALARNIYQAHIKAAPDLRPLILTSSGFAGIQRYAVIHPICGEMDWPDLPKYLTRLLSLNISGAPLLCIDISLENNMDVEFMSRFVQTLAFVPLIRLRFPKGHNLKKLLKAESFLESLDKIFTLRETWLPYLYQLMWSSHTQGTPILYPSVFFYPDWKHGYGVQSSFFIGEHVFVAPVMSKDKILEVELPPGEWIEATSYKNYKGNQKIRLEAGPNTLPMFYREGAVVPRFDNSHPLAEKSVFVTIYPKLEHSSETDIYDDDGETTGYLNEEQTSINLRFSCTKKGHVLKLARRQGRNNPSWSSYIFCFVHSRLDIQKVVYNRKELAYYPTYEELLGKKTGFYLDDETELLHIKFPYEREGGIVRF